MQMNWTCPSATQTLDAGAMVSCAASECGKKVTTTDKAKPIPQRPLRIEVVMRAPLIKLLSVTALDVEHGVHFLAARKTAHILAHQHPAQLIVTLQSRIITGSGTTRWRWCI